MINAINSALNAVGNIPVSALPVGVGYWLTQFGVTSLVGGILSGISAAMTIRITMFFINPLKAILGL